MGAAIKIAILANGSQARREIGGTTRDLDRFGDRAGRAGRASGSLSVGLGKLGAGFAGLKVIEKAGQFLSDANDEAREAQKVGAQTNAVLKSTGSIAGVSARQVGQLSTAISKKAGIDDEAIQSGANLVLTFTNIRNAAGKGNRVFDQTVELGTDMAVALGTNARAGALQLGKALNDPSKGYSKLQRAGVSFTDSQIKQIKTLQKSGDLLGAQKVILGEVRKEFGGSAAAQATAADKAEVAIGNLKEQIGTGLLPVQDKLLKFTAGKLVPGISSFVAGIEDGTGAGGQLAGVLGEVYDTGKAVVGVLDSLPGPVKKLGIEALIAYAALSRLTPMVSRAGGSFSTASAKVRQFRAELSYAETREAAVGNAAYKLGGALRQAAGVGGMLLLANSTQQTSKGLGTLQGAAGGALTGFSAGGPWGAAIGAGIGALGGLYSAIKQGSGAFKVSKGQAEAYAGTLDEVTGAATKASRAQILLNLQQNGTLKAGLSAGLNRRTLVDAALGKPDAVRAVETAIKGVNAALEETKEKNKGLGGKSLQEVNDAAVKTAETTKALNSLVGQQANAYDKQEKKARLAYYATADLGTLLKGFPPAVTTLVKADAKGAYHDIGTLIQRYDLTPREVQTVAGLSGDVISLKKARALIKTYGDAAKPRNTKFDANTAAATAKARALGRELDKAARDRTANIKLTYSGTQNKPKPSTTGGGGQTGGRTATDLVLQGVGSRSSVTFVTNVKVTPGTSPAMVARETEKAQRALALAWGAAA